MTNRQKAEFIVKNLKNVYPIPDQFEDKAVINVILTLAEIEAEEGERK